MEVPHGGAIEAKRKRDYVLLEYRSTNAKINKRKWITVKAIKTDYKDKPIYYRGRVIYLKTYRTK